MIWSLWAESPKRVSRTVQTLFCTLRNTPKHSFAPCKRLFWDSHSRGPKAPPALSLKHFGRFGCSDTCTRPTGSLKPTRSGTFRKPQPLVFSQKYRWYKWEWCTAAFPFLRSLEASKAQRYKWGAYCSTNWRCTASPFQTSCTGWGFPNSPQKHCVTSPKVSQLNLDAVVGIPSFVAVMSGFC